MFLLFSFYFSSLYLKYLKLPKMDITRFAMKLLGCWIWAREPIIMFLVGVQNLKRGWQKVGRKAEGTVASKMFGSCKQHSCKQHL